MKQLVFASIIFFFISCQRGRQINLNDISLTDLSGREASVRDAAGTGIAVFVFMSPDCPLCVNYTKTIRELIVKFSNHGVTFITVYAGRYYSKEEILKFQQEYNFEMKSLLDTEFRLAKILKATVTPEAIVITREGKKVYSGAIDNWMYETGKKSPVITKKYLEAALTQLLNGKVPDPEKTEPFGCFIEL